MSSATEYQPGLGGPGYAAPVSVPWAAESDEPELLAVLRVHLCYLWRHRRILSLRSPTRFTELVQHRKLFNRDTRYARLIDKLEVKAWVGDILGADWITPTLWEGTELPDGREIEAPFVVKSRHGCNQTRFVRTGMEDWASVRRDTKRWMRSDYGRWLDEWAYRGIPRGLMIEPFIGTVDALPIDYKFYVFNGRVSAIQLHLDREFDHRWFLFDREWQRLSLACPTANSERPENLKRMIDAAELLGHGFDFVRVDLYDTVGTPRFGEMSFYPGSGLDPFNPLSLDVKLGNIWLAGM